MIRTAPNATIAMITIFRMLVIFAKPRGGVIVRRGGETRDAIVCSSRPNPPDREQRRLAAVIRLRSNRLTN
jgi:hypothetical protein